MTEASGRTFRRAGLLFEAVSMLLMLATHRGQVPFWKQSGLDPNVILPIVFGVGVLLWFTGTLAIRKARRQND